MTDGLTHVLIVEDNPADARLLRELLAEVHGRRFEVTCVGTLAEAEVAVVGQDVVLLDLSLPDGFGATTVSRMAHAADKAPVIVLTGNTDDEFARQAALLGADDYLLKSEITPSLLARAILYAIERRRGLENARRLAVLEASRAETMRSAERARFLGDLSALFATELEEARILRIACEHVVPRLADCCIADVARDAEVLERVATVGATNAAAVNRLVGNHPRHATSPIVRSVSSRQVVEVPDVAAILDEIAIDAEHRAAVRAMGARTAIVIPLLARDRVLGALTLVVVGGGRTFDEDTRALAHEVARRTALAVDNALLYRSAQRASRARDELIAIVSHDLRNPLSVFALALDSVRRSIEAGTMPTADTVNRGMRAVGRMEHLLGELLDVARIDAGTLAVTKAKIDVASVLRDVIDLNAGLAAEKKIQIDSQLASHSFADADRDRLSQLVTNLLGNAIKFTPRGGQIVVSCRPSGSGIEVSVADSGPGVPTESAPHVFDRFYQSERGKGGVGLGLAIAKGIVDAHGGRIGVDTRAGQGARFWFELPRSAHEGRA